MLNLGEEQASLTSNMQENFSRTGSEENLEKRTFNLIKGRNGPTAFLPLSPRIGRTCGGLSL